MATSSDLQRRIDDFVRELAEEFGQLPDSDESLMTKIEDWAMEVGDAVTTSAVTRKLAAESATDHPVNCPTCGRRGRLKGIHRRSLQTRRGDVHLEENEYFCSSCRKSFFPGESSSGD